MNNLPEHVQYTLQKLIDETDPIMEQTFSIPKKLKSENFDIYTPTYAEKMKAEMLINPRLKLHNVLRKYINETKQSVQQMKERILDKSVPKLSDNPNETIAKSLKFQEIRNLLRNKDMKERKQLIKDNIENGNGDFLLAAVDSPDSLLPEKTLNEFREKFAFKQEPELKEWKHQREEIAEHVRKTAGQINSSQIEIYLSEKLEDPLNIEQHIVTFPPRTEREQQVTESSISRERDKKRLERDKQKFEADNNGINI